ncbi:hypothetical protein EDEG_04231, partial [Edhazardia aedis USNM 41457]
IFTKSQNVYKYISIIDRWLSITKKQKYNEEILEIANSLLQEMICIHISFYQLKNFNIGSENIFKNRINFFNSLEKYQNFLNNQISSDSNLHDNSSDVIDNFFTEVNEILMLSIEQEKKLLENSEN